MRRSSVPRRRKFEGFNWISVQDEGEVLPGKQKKRVGTSYPLNFSTGYSFADAEAVDEYLITAEIEASNLKSPSTRKSGSVIPRSSNYVNRNSNKYYCPYYIKPKYWEKINAAPRFDEKLETEKIQNFYNFMHTGAVNPNPFEVENEDKWQSTENIKFI